MGVDAVVNPDYVATPEGAALSAVWFWNSRDLNRLADRGAMVDITRKINGGVMGLEDRMKRYEHALEVLKS